jgi:catechol 2,3-dioxygenase-like lactoylglutathione lyase family enzyme
VVAVAEGPPPVWVGHVLLGTADVAAAARFYEQIGMRPVTVNERFAAFEMRGGTHLALRHDPEAVVAETIPWDLMVDDLDRTHDLWQADGLCVTDIVEEEGAPHRRFAVTDPDGHILMVRDSHVVGPV